MHDEEGLYLEITPDKKKPETKVKYRVFIDTITFDEKQDRITIPWLYEQVLIRKINFNLKDWYEQYFNFSVEFSDINYYNWFCWMQNVYK